MTSDEMSTNPERRRAERHDLRFPVDYSSVDAFFSEMATNINEGGMFIATDNPAQLGEVVQLAFHLPGLVDPVTLSARVAWTSDGKDGSEIGMGVEFMELTPEVRQTINDLVRRLRVTP